MFGKLQVPMCGNCGQSMALARVVPALGGLPELQSFECRQCRLAYTREAPKTGQAVPPPRSGPEE